MSVEQENKQKENMKDRGEYEPKKANIQIVTV